MAQVIDATYPSLREEREAEHLAVLLALFADQRTDVLALGRILGSRWDKAVAKRLLDLNMTTATLVGDKVASAAGGAWNPTQMRAWLQVNADLSAQAVNDHTRAALAAAEGPEGKAVVFDHLDTSAEGYARSTVTTSGNFGAHDAAEQSGVRYKVWRASGRSKRHASLNGVRVRMQDTFSVNGSAMRWPGDPEGGAAEVANCGCSIRFDVEG